MSSSLWEKFGSSINSTLISKIISIAVIFLLAQLAVKIFSNTLKRGQRLAAKKLKDPLGEISSLETRFDITRRIIIVGIYSFALMLILLQFEAVRSIGVGLLASAGLASVVLGLAAQNTLSNIIAGISISFSQPVRLRDAVIFKNEFGVIEEISLMHSTILTWDNRRIIVPNSVMASEVIENWTIKDSTLIGTVMFYADYACDVDRVRIWVKDIVASSSNTTSERMCAVQVVDFTERAMVLRILVKGPNPGKTWDLRCEVRESLIKKFKESGLPLPEIRVGFHPHKGS
ncbi:MAG: mechanosensitive ion channel family protein [Candidatus Omnitrophica bacterium]|nr:mechanosensitive ion channel family protein [Candidatus Omnitrophota bacterium]